MREERKEIEEWEGKDTEEKDPGHRVTAASRRPNGPR